MTLPNLELNLINVFLILNGDVMICLKMLRTEEGKQEGKSLFYRRAYVKAVYALIEGVTFNLKQYAIQVSTANGQVFDASEIQLLMEETFEVSDSGDVKKSAAKISLIKSIQHAFRAVTKANGIEFVIKKSDPGWEKLLKGIKIRDRLTHPKQVSDLLVTEEEYKSVLQASSWFIQNFNGCFDAIKIKLERELQQ